MDNRRAKGVVHLDFSKADTVQSLLIREDSLFAGNIRQHEGAQAPSEGPGQAEGIALIGTS